MSNSEGAIKLWFAAVVITLLLFVGIGIFFLAAPRAQIEAEPEDYSQVIVPAPPAPNDVEPEAIEPERLVVNDVLLEPAQREIEGSVMNGAEVPYVNVQVHFSLFDSTGQEVGTVGDTTSTVAPGGTWRFRLILPADVPVTRAELDAVVGTPSYESM